MQTILALFNTDQGAGEALKMLSEKGWDQGVRIVREDAHGSNNTARSEEDQPFDNDPELQAALGSALLRPERVGAGNTVSLLALGEMGEKALHEMLSAQGIGSDEARFYAEQVRRGSTLLLAEVAEEQAQEAKQQLEQLGGRTPN